MKKQNKIKKANKFSKNININNLYIPSLLLYNHVLIYYSNNNKT